MHLIEFILYVSDQKVSKEFYSRVLNLEPSLDVPGMTEFNLGENIKLGIMPENGIAKLLGDGLPHPSSGSGTPRCELYLKTPEAQAYLTRAMEHGAKLIMDFQLQTWGDTVAYVADADGHILALAKV